MKLHLFESFQNIEGIFPLGNISQTMIPTDQESLDLFRSFLKKVVYQTVSS